MLRHAGVGDAIKALAGTYAIDLLLLGWGTAAVLKIAQGSTTVALIAASSILWPMMDPAQNAPLPIIRCTSFSPPASAAYSAHG